MKTINLKKIFLITGFILAFNSITYASENLDENKQNIIYISDLVYDISGNILNQTEEELSENEISSEIQPMYNPMQTFYKQKNKKGLGSFTKITEYLTSDWAFSNNYKFTTSKTFKSSWSISGSVEVKKAIDLTGGYTRSVSKGYTVSTSIPANKDRQSKLVRETKYDKYSVSVYKYRSNGYQSTKEEYIGKANIDSPDSTYIVVKYK